MDNGKVKLSKGTSHTVPANPVKTDMAAPGFKTGGMGAKNANPVKPGRSVKGFQSGLIGGKI